MYYRRHIKIHVNIAISHDGEFYITSVAVIFLYIAYCVSEAS